MLPVSSRRSKVPPVLQQLMHAAKQRAELPCNHHRIGAWVRAPRTEAAVSRCTICGDLLIVVVVDGARITYGDAASGGCNGPRPVTERGRA